MAPPTLVMPRSRALDWTCAAMILAWGIVLLLPGETFTSPAYEFLADLGTEAAWGSTLIVIGALRVVALIVNGHWQEGSPVMRAVAAALGVIVWSLFLAGFVDLSIARSAVSPGAGVYLVLLGADLFSCARAGADAVRARQVARVQRV